MRRLWRLKSLPPVEGAACRSSTPNTQPRSHYRSLQPPSTTLPLRISRPTIQPPSRRSDLRNTAATTQSVLRKRYTQLRHADKPGIFYPSTVFLDDSPARMAEY